MIMYRDRVFKRPSKISIHKPLWPKIRLTNRTVNTEKWKTESDTAHFAGRGGARGNINCH